MLTRIAEVSWIYRNTGRSVCPVRVVTCEGGAKRNGVALPHDVECLHKKQLLSDGMHRGRCHCTEHSARFAMWLHCGSAVAVPLVGGVNRTSNFIRFPARATQSMRSPLIGIYEIAANLGRGRTRDRHKRESKGNRYLEWDVVVRSGFMGTLAHRSTFRVDGRARIALAVRRIRGLEN